MKKEEEQKETLDSFGGWEENTPEIDFFGDTTVEEEEPKKEGIKAEKASSTEEEETKVEETEEIQDIDFFGTKDVEEGTKEVSEESTEEIEDLGTSSVTTLNFLKEKGLVDFELEEGVELTDSQAEELLEDSFDKKVEGRIEELFGELPQIVKDFNKFAINGGDVSQFLNSVSKKNTSGITSDINLEEEANQELIVTNHLRNEGYDDDYITGQLEYLKDSNQLGKISRTHFGKWKSKYDKEQENLVLEQKQKVKAEKETRRQLKNKVTTLLKDTQDLSGVKISKSDRKTLPSYMTDRNVKLDNGATITPMQRDLYAALQDDNKAVLIAKLLSNNFNFKDIEVKAETKVATKVKENIRRNKTNTPLKSATGSSQTQSKRLADYF